MSTEVTPRTKPTTELASRTKPTTGITLRAKPEPVEEADLLMEDGGFLLLEAGDYIMLTEASDGTSLTTRTKP